MSGRPKKNPDVKDSERERNLKRRVLEERAEAEEKWKWRGSKTPEEKLADYLKDKKIDDHITYRILKPVIYGLKYGMKYYPTTPEEKYLEIIGLNLLRQKISKIRLDDKFGYVGIGSGIIHENPNTGDMENIICDMSTTIRRGSKLKSVTVEQWEEARNKVEYTLIEGTNKTVKNSLRSKEEREKLLKKEMERRKQQQKKNKNDDNEDDKQN